jgi:ribosomal protein S18 acetylase RimI-like enzyme
MVHVAGVALRPAVEGDREFLFALHRASLKEYVAATYGPWDDQRQRELFDAKFAPARYQIITRAGADVGCLRVEDFPDHVALSLIEILPAHQRQGVGTAVVQFLIARARAQRLPLRLHVFKVNPARRLYERLGFTQLAETPTHYIMQLPPSP